MAKLKDRVENALNETRILVLGLQILIGFAYRTFFEPGFDKVPFSRHLVELIALSLMLVGLAILVMPVSYHRLVLDGRDTVAFQRLTSATVSIGLLPFALSMALSFYLALRFVATRVTAVVVAGALLGVTLFFWYGLEILARRRKLGALHLHAIVDPQRGIAMQDNKEEQTDLNPGEAGLYRVPGGAAGRAGPSRLSVDHHVDDRLLQNAATLEATPPGQPHVDCHLHHPSHHTGGVSPHR